MKVRFFLVIAIMLFGMQGLSFGEVNKPFGRTIMVAAKPTAKVEIYVTSWCPYCTQAIKFFKDNHIPYVAYDIEKDSASRKTKRKTFPASRCSICGYQWEKDIRLLRRSILAGPRSQVTSSSDTTQGSPRPFDMKDYSPILCRKNI